MRGKQCASEISSRIGLLGSVTRHERRSALRGAQSDNVGRGSGPLTWVSNRRGIRSARAIEILARRKADQALKEAGVTSGRSHQNGHRGSIRSSQRCVDYLKPWGAAGRLYYLSFTLSSSKGPPVLFKSFDQISKAFPPGYNFLIFKHRDPYSGAYELGPADGVLNFNADGNQHNVIAFPSEKKDRIPLKGPIRK